MRFGKRNRNPLAMGWRVKAQPEESEFSPVASEERDALLSSTPIPDEEETYENIEETAPGSATQRLSVTLGRFERQVAKASEGAPQEVWSDECMNQLINAVEIAVTEGWQDVVEALTETARILQSYENVGQAHLAVPFLVDSYEVLCLMVGDLIVGKVRSGVMQKWRNRYRIALEELKDAGIPLIRDDEEPESRSARPAIRELEPLRPAPREEAAEPRRPAGILRSMYANDPPSEEEEPPAAYEPAPFRMHEESEPEAPMELPPLESNPPVFADAEPPARGEQSRFDELPDLMGELPPLSPMRMDLLGLSGLEDTPPAEPEAEATEEDASSGVIERLDVLCEQLSTMERDPEADRMTPFLTILDSVAFLEEQAERGERLGCIDLCRMMARVCDSAESLPGPLDDKFFELAYAFCGVYVEADDRPGNTMIQSWIAECQTLLEAWATRGTEIAEEPAPEFAPEPEMTYEPEPEPEFEAEYEAEPEIETEPEYEVVAEPEIEAEEEIEVELAVEEVAAIEPEPVAPVDEEQPVGERPDEEPEMKAAPLTDLSGTLESLPEATQEAASVEETAVIEPVAVAAAVADPSALAAEPAALVTEDSPESLLSVAQQAMSLGRAADAKKMALRAAAMLAQMEVDDAARRVTEAEQRLRQGADMIEQARVEVQQAESKVNDAAQAVVDGDKTLADTRTEAAQIGSRLEEVEARVADLDEQIRQLQMKRDEEAQRMAETRENLEQARSLETAAEADLNALRSYEDDARVRLEDTRQRVKTLQRKRTEVEAAMERAREHLTRQRLSLAEIQQTLAQVGGRTEDTVEEDHEEFLF